MNRLTSISVLLVILSSMMGCSQNPLLRDEFDAQQNWEAQSLDFDPENINTLYAYDMSFSEESYLWVGDSFGYLSGQEKLIRRETWRVLMVYSDGRTEESMALLSRCATSITFLFPEMERHDIMQAHVYVISGSGRYALSSKGEFIKGVISRDEDGGEQREQFSLENLKTDREYQSRFVTAYPSKLSGVYDFSPNTKAGKLFLQGLHVQFPILAKIGGETYAVNGRTEDAAGESNHDSLVDAIASRGFTIGLADAGDPKIFLGRALYSLAMASQVPLRGSFLEAKYSGLEVAKTMAPYLACRKQLP